MPNNFPILFYHNITNNDTSATSLDHFDMQMNFLFKRGFKTYSLTDLIKRKSENPSIKAFAITFDDGYKDNLTNALPILQKYNFLATCFIVHDYIGKSNLWDFNNKNIKQHELMNSEEINDWIDNGMEIGSHGLSHCNLINKDLITIKNELITSKSSLELKFNTKIDSFCYPYGSYNNEVINEVINAGYKYALTTKRGRAKISNNYYQLPRIPIGSKVGLFKFYLKTQTIYEDF